MGDWDSLGFLHKAQLLENRPVTWWWLSHSHLHTLFSDLHTCRLAQVPDTTHLHPHWHSHSSDTTPSPPHAEGASSTNLRQLGFAALDLPLANVKPDAGDPVREQGKHGHEQCQHHGAVLRVPVQPRKQAQQAQQAHSLQQMGPEVLRCGEGGREGGREVSGLALPVPWPSPPTQPAQPH